VRRSGDRAAARRALGERAVGHHASDDQGKTWSGLVQVSLPSEDPATFDDPTCVAEGGKLWVAYGIGTEPFDPAESPRALRLRVARSDDGGQTFANHAFAEDPRAARIFSTRSSRVAPTVASRCSTTPGRQEPGPAGSLRLATSSDALTCAERRAESADHFPGARPVQNCSATTSGSPPQVECDTSRTPTTRAASPRALLRRTVKPALAVSRTFCSAAGPRFAQIRGPQTGVPIFRGVILRDAWRSCGESTDQVRFITGGVVSSIGKGLASASIGALMEARGLRSRT